MYFLSRGILLSLLALDALAHTVTRTANLAKRVKVDRKHFVTQEGGKLMVNGSEFNFVGTTAYWLPSLNTDEDINNTLASIRKAGFNAVRTWAFNDVDTVPENGTWFQLVQNGTLTINEGPNGLQKLDRVVNLAQNHGIYILLSLTNNWNPHPSDSVNITDPLSALGYGPPGASTAATARPRGTLSNDYGGMDIYVRQFGGPQEHDQFFTNKTLVDAFKNFTTQIVTRYADHPNVLSWELANDPRCSSSVAASPGCNAQNITRWHADLAEFVSNLDPNHIVSTGHQGFFCTGCPKLFPRITPPRPRPSPAPGRRSPKAEPLTVARLVRERREAFKKTRAANKGSVEAATGVQIRGRWISTPTRRQEPVVGSAFDGSQGVDSEDIFNIPQIGLSSFMLFPDQNSYGVDDPNLPRFNNTLNQGLDWIRRQAENGRLFGKPIGIAGAGIVPQQNAQAFVPFNGTVAPFATAETGAPLTKRAPSDLFTQDQANGAMTDWLQESARQGLQGMIQYQWSQPDLTAQPGTVISPTSQLNTQTPITGVGTQTGVSPNDGYGAQDIGFLSGLASSINSIFSRNSHGLA